MGIAIGVWTNFIPILGIHNILAIAISYIFKANIISSIFGVFISGLPFIFPVLWYLSWYIGSLFLRDHYIEFTFPNNENITEMVIIYFYETMVGSIIIAPFIITVTYFISKRFIISWQNFRNYNI